MSVSIFLTTVLSKDALLHFSSAVAFIYFLSCILHAQAVYERLRIPFSWQRCVYLLTLATFGVYFLTAVYPYQPLRILLIGFATAAFYLHRPILFLQGDYAFKIDRFLKIFVVSLASIAILRAILLASFLDHDGFIGHYEPIWALTQLLLIFINLVSLSVFVSCAILDLVAKLKLDRQLDPLTGLLNRRGLDEHLERISAQPIENHAILMADLDHFKAINDHYGHHVGDLVLQHISQIFKQNIREQDKVSRVGGEEFVIILHNIHADAALKIADRIRQSIEETPLVEKNHVIYLTISIGVSFFNTPEQIEATFLEADQLLYHAKEMGRNQIQVA
ncbi:GGDEF domain-containing protein [Acinetobacter sp. NCu2D-2]|uniref:GGDEF domain-containing protein n=1 Tax=Acinetobacter sp. NCu2D-2 TaxID=1608473 RepID=UPI001D0D77D5|nr:GGDEF domain-containing protein [Acinetobacter sp. NCu2D-2]